MLIKCTQCARYRNLIRFSTLKIFKTPTVYFCSDKGKGLDKEPSHGKYESPGTQSFFKTLKEHREKTMMIDNVPDKETVGSLLKVQRASQTISKDFKTVYKFPAIKYFGLVNRLKVYQTVFTLLASTASTGFYICGVLPPDFIFLSTVIGISGCLMFYSLGYVAARFVGFIYYNEKTQMVRIAYVDFWGRRRDIEVPVSDIVPRSESAGGFINKVWFPLRRYSSKETLKLQLDQGIILDTKALNKIL